MLSPSCRAGPNPGGRLKAKPHIACLLSSLFYMLLSEIEELAGVAVKRDGEVQSLGFVYDRREGLLVFLETSRFLRALRRNKSVRAVLTTDQLAASVAPGVAVATCPEPRAAFAKLHNQLACRGFYWADFPTVIDSAAEVHPTA